MILLSPIGEPHYLVLLMVPFASIADAAARGEAEPRVIYAAIASYLVAFSRYPLTLLHHFGLGSAAFFWIANQFGFTCYSGGGRRPGGSRRCVARRPDC